MIEVREASGITLATFQTVIPASGIIALLTLHILYTQCNNSARPRLCLFHNIGISKKQDDSTHYTKHFEWYPPTFTILPR